MTQLPYKIATLVYIFDDCGNTLLLHRKKTPNQGLYSPIGGKLEQAIGESPYQCAMREVEEEIGLSLDYTDIRLCGIVAEKAYEGATHWLMFCFEVTRGITLTQREIPEGQLEWVPISAVQDRPIPESDRKAIWPMMLRHSAQILKHQQCHANPDVFSLYLDCSMAGRMRVVHEHPAQGQEK
ncbi:MAG: NUDIX hydrolase [Phycisphaerae bacterium]